MQSDIIQWFPGHMAKTRRMMKECLPQVDILIELLDARIPFSSQNPEIKKLSEGKPTLTLLNKSSLADPAVTAKWIEYFAKKGKHAIAIDCTSGEGLSSIPGEIREVLSKKIERYNSKGMTGRHLRAMLVGIPNVGKSSFINCLAKAKRTKVEDRPGVTVDKQWISTDIGFDLLDMPGVLWPKFDEKRVGENLAITGAIKDAILDTEEIAMILCQRLKERYSKELCERYKLNLQEIADLDGYDIFNLIGKRRGFLMSGGAINESRTATAILDEFRSATIGRISLEVPKE